MSATTEPQEITAWTQICPIDHIVPDTGVGALVNGQQVAVFRLLPNNDLYAISAHDPFSGANVLARGIVGDKAGTPIVASPIYKQLFDLRDGQCLDDESVKLASFPVRLTDGMVEVGHD